jgi:hypothetical protein
MHLGPFGFGLGTILQGHAGLTGVHCASAAVSPAACESIGTMTAKQNSKKIAATAEYPAVRTFMS